METLAHGCVLERERERECGRGNHGQRVTPRPGETWLRMLHQLDLFDRMPLDFTRSPPADQVSILMSHDIVAQHCPEPEHRLRENGDIWHPGCQMSPSSEASENEEATKR